MVLVPNPPHHPRGDCGLAGGRVLTACAETWTFSGLSVLRPGLLADCASGAFQLWPLLREAAIRGRVGGEVYLGRWSDVGAPDRLQALEDSLDHTLEGAP